MSENMTQAEQTSTGEATASTETTTTEQTSQTSEQEIASSFVNGKYKTVSDLEKGYENLQSKFGSFSGAPEAYNLSEGIEINNEHPILESLQSFGKENNLSNEGYEKLVNVLVENEKANLADIEAQKQEVLKGLGENATERMKNIDDFVGANMQLDDNLKGLVDMAKEQPGGVELLEAFIGMSKKTSPASEQVATPTKVYSKDELTKLQFATDSYGNRKMASDPQYRKMVDEYTAKLLAQG